MKTEGTAPAHRVHSCHTAVQEEPGWPPGQERVKHLRRAGKIGLLILNTTGNELAMALSWWKSSNHLPIHWGKFKHKALHDVAPAYLLFSYHSYCFPPLSPYLPQLSTPPYAPGKLAYLRTCWAPSPPHSVHVCSPLPLKGPFLVLDSAWSSSFRERSLFPRKSSQSTQSKSKHIPA